MVEVKLEAPDSADASRCLQSYVDELARRFEGGFDTSLGNSLDPEDVRPPHGWFVLARLDGKVVGCGALKRLEPGIGEIKRVWTDDAARGKGVARAIMSELEATAKREGLAIVRLDTNKALIEARTMYQRMGYVEVAPYNDNPFADFWFEKTL